MIAAILAKVFGTKNEREIKRLNKRLRLINDLETHMQALSDEALKQKTTEFKERIKQGESLHDILPEAFAAVREASRRALNMRHYDVQLIGGMVLHEGKIAEMKTGEGKTLAATLALYLNSLSGKGAHLVTVNDYLARRDAEWNRPLFAALDTTVGIIQHGMSDEERKAAYDSDITYGTNNEFGFDYLRDNMKFSLDDYSQRELNFAIVDEVDSILIDEARTPLIISGPSQKGSALYLATDKVVRRLKKDEDFEVDEKARSAHLTENGIDTVEKLLNIENLFAPEHTLLQHHINQALRAHSLFSRDVDYMVIENEVLIVDEFTGRVLPGRRYSDGLHQALEAKEGVKIENENQTLASITLQNYFRMYNKLAGMTGTAKTEAEEFHRIYKLDVVSIPPNKPVIRVDEPDAVFLTQQDKFEAIIEDILETHKKGNPCLVGTTSVETSELISRLLSQRGIPHNVLNAKHHEREAEIITEAGEMGRITIATNMAGRGTDIKLGAGVLDVGGLRIIGSERHESRRIDNQLRGRAGRQGDAGSSKFYISFEDNLIRVFSGDRLKNMMQRVGMQPGERIEHPMVSRSIENSQEKVEKHHFDSRKNLIEYDDVLNQQRKVVYAYRRELLEGSEHTIEIIRELLHDTISIMITGLFPKGAPTQENIEEFYKGASILVGVPIETIKSELEGLTITHTDGTDAITQRLFSRYESIRNKIDATLVKDVEKWTLLEVVDQYWKIHLQVLDSLKEGIGLRGYGQKNPLIEYKRESFDAFTKMMNAIKWDSLQRLFHIKPEHFSQEQINSLEHQREEELAELKEIGNNDANNNNEPVKRNEKKVGRNDSCPCGSEKKYKHCCGKS